MLQIFLIITEMLFLEFSFNMKRVMENIYFTFHDKKIKPPTTTIWHQVDGTATVLFIINEIVKKNGNCPLRLALRVHEVKNILVI